MRTLSEDDARAWIATRVSRETERQLSHYVASLLHETEHQNLISAASKEVVWSRHIVDALQLLDLEIDGTVADIGSGAGLPGLALAIAGAVPMTLIEPRRLRCEFLARIVRELSLEKQVSIVQSRVEAFTGGPFDVIVARAYASIDRLLGSSLHVADGHTRWLMPKGKTVADEIETAERRWHVDLETGPSITDDAARIVVARNVRARKPC